MKLEKALSIRQPWAYLIAIGIKDIENRNWWTKFRGWFAIHASKTFEHDAVDWINTTLDHTGHSIRVPSDPKAYKIGGFIGATYLNDCVDYDDSIWFEGKHGFKLRRSLQFDELIPCRGQLNFFNIPDNLKAQVNETAQRKIEERAAGR